jgi:hypothetical protein
VIEAQNKTLGTQGDNHKQLRCLRRVDKEKAPRRGLVIISARSIVLPARGCRSFAIVLSLVSGVFALPAGKSVAASAIPVRILDYSRALIRCR